MDEQKEYEMNHTLRNKLARLLDVKSIVTLLLVAVMAIMTAGGQPVSELFSSSVMLILGFFFGKRNDPKGDKSDDQQ
jgi:hypothetical protein